MYNKLKSIPVFFIFFTLLLQTGCGYQLQKPLVLDATLQPVYIEGDSSFKILLVRRLQAQDLALTNSPTSANSRIKITAANQEQRSASVSSDGRDAEHLSLNSVYLSWLKGNEIIIPPTLITAEAIQIGNPEQLTAQQAESDLINTEIRNEIIDKALRLIRYASQQPKS